MIISFFSNFFLNFALLDHSAVQIEIGCSLSVLQVLKALKVPIPGPHCHLEVYTSDMNLSKCLINASGWGLICVLRLQSLHMISALQNLFLHHLSD